MYVLEGVSTVAYFITAYEGSQQEDQDGPVSLT